MTTTIRALDAVVTPAVGDKIPTDQAADNVTRYLTADQILGLVATISQAEAEAGTATTRRIFTAERVSQAIAALAAPKIRVLAKTGTYTVTTADLHKLVDATSGTWSLNLPAAATAADGFWLAVRNSGTGVITVDPSGAELIDGASTMVFGPGASGIVVCTGAAWKSIGMLSQRAESTTRTAGDLATTSATLADLLTITKVVPAGAVLLVLVGCANLSDITQFGNFNLMADGALVLGTVGVRFQGRANNFDQAFCVAALATVTTGGSKTFRAQYSAEGGVTLTVQADTALPLHFFVIALPGAI